MGSTKPTAEAVRADAAMANLRAFVPTVPQRRFFEAVKSHRFTFFVAGNGAGKTTPLVKLVGGIIAGMEQDWMPYPANGRTLNVMLCGVAQEQARDVFAEHFQQFFNKTLIAASTSQKGLPSTMDFWSPVHVSVYTQGKRQQGIQGGRWDVIGFDEHPPQDMWEEAIFRYRPDQETKIIVCMTPTMAESWLQEKLRGGETEDVAIIEASVFENGTEPCVVCGWDRAQWDAQLRFLGTTRRVGTGVNRDWLAAQVGATHDSHVANAKRTREARIRFDHAAGYCARCWTYGTTSRYPFAAIKANVTHTPNTDRLAMRLLGTFLSGTTAEAFTLAERDALLAYAATFEGREEGNQTTWLPPQAGHGQCVGMDPAEGTGRDETCLTGLDCGSRHQTFLWASRDLPLTTYIHDTRAILNRLRVAIGTAPPILVEANRGRVLIDFLAQTPGVDVVRHQDDDYGAEFVLKAFPTPHGQMGFVTSGRTRQRLLMQALAAVRFGLQRQPDGTCVVVPGVAEALYLTDPETVRQFTGCRYDDRPEKNGRVVTLNNRDDRLFALALAWEAMRIRVGTAGTVDAAPGQPYRYMTAGEWQGYVHTLLRSARRPVSSRGRRHHGAGR